MKTTRAVRNALHSVRRGEPIDHEMEGALMAKGLVRYSDEGEVVLTSAGSRAISQSSGLSW